MVQLNVIVMNAEINKACINKTGFTFGAGNSDDRTILLEVCSVTTAYDCRNT